MSRKILHLDLDAFFCAVEEQFDPSLRGKAFAVGGKPDERGVVASCSYPARVFGVRSAMPMSQAVRLCPDLLIVSHQRGAYEDMSRQVMAILHDTTPFVEQLSIDEAFLDVTLLPDPAEDIARRLQARINAELDLPCSIGVAANKLVAKIANNVGKSEKRGPTPPNAIKVVPPGQEAAFLSPLPTSELWGVGPRTAERLADLGIRTTGDLAQWPEADLERRFGKQGRDLSRRARGLDDRPVETEQETRSVSAEVTFTRDIGQEGSLRETLRRLSEDVGRRLRKSGLRGRTVHLKLRWPDFTTLTRQVTLPHPTDQDKVITLAATALFEKNWHQDAPVRLLGVGVSGFDEEPYQLGLWDPPDEEDRRLQETLDALRDRFGSRAIRRASDLKRRQG